MRASLCVSRAGVVLSGVPAVGGACAPLPVHSAPPSPPGRGRGQGPQVSRASQGRSVLGFQGRNGRHEKGHCQGG